MLLLTWCLVYILRLLRRVGQSGNALVTWAITSQSAGAPNPAGTFNATSGSVNMPSGVDTVLLPIKVSQHRDIFPN